MYWFKRKYRQIQRVIDFLPIIWKGFDFDYIYSIELFKKQLERQAKFMESSDKAHLENAKLNAAKIRTAIRLMDKVYNGEYSMEYMDTIEQHYGETQFQFKEIDKKDENGDPCYELTSWNEGAVDSKHQEEINELKHQLMLLARNKQKRAHKLLWAFIEHNIQKWWD